jgi:hypothetical protein
VTRSTGGLGGPDEKEDEDDQGVVQGEGDDKGEEGEQMEGRDEGADEEGEDEDDGSRSGAGIASRGSSASSYADRTPSNSARKRKQVTTPSGLPPAAPGKKRTPHQTAKKEGEVKVSKGQALAENFGQGGLAIDKLLRQLNSSFIPKEMEINDLKAHSYETALLV